MKYYHKQQSHRTSTAFIFCLHSLASHLHQYRILKSLNLYIKHHTMLLQRQQLLNTHSTPHRRAGAVPTSTSSRRLVCHSSAPMHVDVAVIGAGPAGLSAAAALSTADPNLKVVLVLVGITLHQQTRMEDVWGLHLPPLHTTILLPASTPSPPSPPLGPCV